MHVARQLEWRSCGKHSFIFYFQNPFEITRFKVLLKFHSKTLVISYFFQNFNRSVPFFPISVTFLFTNLTWIQLVWSSLVCLVKSLVPLKVTLILKSNKICLAPSIYLITVSSTAAPIHVYCTSYCVLSFFFSALHSFTCYDFPMHVHYLISCNIKHTFVTCVENISF